MATRGILNETCRIKPRERETEREGKGHGSRRNSLVEAEGAEVHSSESTVITQDIEQRDADCAKL